MLGLRINHVFLLTVSSAVCLTGYSWLWALVVVNIIALYVATEFGGPKTEQAMGTSCFVSGVFRQRIHLAKYLRSCSIYRQNAHLMHEEGHARTYANLLRIATYAVCVGYVYVVAVSNSGVLISVLLSNVLAYCLGFLMLVALEVLADANIKHPAAIQEFVRFLQSRPNTINNLRVEILNARTPRP